MSTKKLVMAVILLLGLNLLMPMATYAEETTPTDEYEYMLYDTQDDSVTSTDDSYTTTSDDYDFNFEWDGTTENLTEEEATAIAAVMALFSGVFLVVMIVMSLVMYVYYGLTFMTIAQKLNVPSPWMAWVPFANMILFARCAGFRAWTAILFFVPAVNFVYSLYGFMKVCERRGFNNLLGLLMLVPVANLIIPGYIAWAEPKKVQE